MKTVFKQFKRSLLSPVYQNRLTNDLKKFEQTKIPNTAEAYQNMINAFCATGGASHSKCSDYISSMYPPGDFSLLKEDSIFDLKNIDFHAAGTALKQQGYYILPQTLDEKYIQDLFAFALQEEAIIRPMDGAGKASATDHMERIDLDHPRSIIYSLPEKRLINHPIIQKIVLDYLFLTIAQNYLNTTPIWDVTSLWWSTNASKRSDKNAAQWFHFDMDRIRWLKVFIYLTDVGTENGPHTFIAGSSRDGDIPKKLLAQGYKRLSDDEVSAAYHKEKYIEFTAPKGTIIIEDTRGLHKGKNVTGAARCLLQFQYSNSLFGGAYPKVTIQSEPSALKNKINGISSRILSHYE